MCRECRTNEEVEDCNNWLLQCPRWNPERHLLTSVEERLPNFSSFTDGIQCAAITDLACEDSASLGLYTLVLFLRTCAL